METFRVFNKSRSSQNCKRLEYKWTFSLWKFLLNSTDAVARVGTPFEHSNVHSHQDKFKNAYYDFKVALGFSKRGWNKIKKDLKEK